MDGDTKKKGELKMTKEEQEAVIYTAHANLAGNRKYDICMEAFEEGWKAAYNHLCNLPFDVMLQELVNHLNDRDNELRDKVYEIAKAHGWHDKDYSDEHFCMLIVTEISEAINADRCNKHAGVKAYNFEMDYALHYLKLYGKRLDTYQKEKFEAHIKDTVEDELADVVIRLLDLSGLYEIDFNKMPEAFVINDNRLEEMMIADIKSMSMTEFAYRCTFQTMKICEYDISPGFIETLLHYIYLYCHCKHIDLEWHVNEKIRYNQTREYKHGKRY